MDWVPTLNDRGGPVYRRIVEALAADIASGRLRRGQQLPTHRALAQTLGVDLTTVTRAYGEARQRGLTEARVGQGTFVAESRLQARPPGALAFDLSMNLPPQPIDADIEGRIARGIEALHRDVGIAPYLNYREPGGSEDERAAAAEWLRDRIPDAGAERIVICPGTQAALTSTLLALTTPGDVILTEALTYPGLKAVAAHLGLRLIGVTTDEFGLIPKTLKAAIRQHAPKAVYLIPTIQNPTTVTMPAQRRAEIAEIVRAHRLLLLEDDAYGALAPAMAPLASLIPERTWHMATLSKCIAPGLRVSFLLAPDRAVASRTSEALRAIVQMPVPLMVALVARWLRDGSADAMIAAIRDEAAARQKIAAQALAGHPFAAHPNGHHIWVPLPRRWSRAEFAAHVQRQGLAVVTSEAFAVGDAPPHAIRVSLGAASSRAELARALDVLASVLGSAAATSRIV